MTKHEFMKELEHLLGKLPEDERRDILYDYEEHFQFAMADGKSEDEIVSSLGNPKAITKTLLADYYITNAKENRSAANITRAIIAVVALGFFNLVFVFGLFIGIAVSVVSLYAAALATIVVPIGLLFRGILFSREDLFAGFFNVMMCVGFGVLMLIGLIYVTRWLYFISLRYLQFNVKIAKGE